MAERLANSKRKLAKLKQARENQSKGSLNSLSVYDTLSTSSTPDLPFHETTTTEYTNHTNTTTVLNYDDVDHLVLGGNSVSSISPQRPSPKRSNSALSHLPPKPISSRSSSPHTSQDIASQNAYLQSLNSNLSHENTNLSQEISQTRKEISSLTRKITALTSEIETLKSVKAVEDAQWEKDYEIIEENRMRVQLMENDLKDFQNKLRIAEDKLKAALEELEQVKSRNAALEQNPNINVEESPIYIEVVEERDDLADKLMELAEEHIRLQEETQAKISALEQMLEQKDDSGNLDIISRYEVEKKELLERLETLETQYNLLQSDATSSNDQELTSTIQSLQVQNQELLSKLEELQTRYDQLVSQINSNTESPQEHHSNINVEESPIYIEVVEERDDLADKLMELAEEHIRLQEETQAKISALEQMLEQKDDSGNLDIISRYEVEKKELLERLETLETQYNLLQSDATSSNDQELTSTIQTLQVQNQELLSKLEELQTGYDQLVNQINSNNESSSPNNVDEMISKKIYDELLASHAVELETLKQACLEKDDEIDKFSDMIQNLSDRITSKENAGTKKEQEMATLLSEKVAVYNQLNQNFQSVVEENEKFAEMIQNLSDQIITSPQGNGGIRSEQEVEALLSEKDSLYNQLNETHQLVLHEKENLSSQLTELSQIHQSAIEENEKFSEMIQDLSDKLFSQNESEKNHEVTDKSISEKDAQYTELNEMYQNLLIEKDSLSSQFVELTETSNRENKKFSEIIQQLSDKVSLSSQEKQGMKTQEEIDHILNEKDSRYNKLQETYQFVHDEKDILINQFSVLSEEKDSLSSRLVELTELHQNVVQENDKFSEMIQELSDQLSAASQEKMGLKSQDDVDYLLSEKDILYNQLNEKYQNVVQENYKFSEMIQELSDQLTAASQEKMGLKNQDEVDYLLSEKDMLYNQLNETYQNAVQENDKFSEIIQELSDQLSAASQEKIGLKSPAEVDYLLSEKDTQYNQLNESYQHLVQEKDSLTSQFYELNASYQNVLNENEKFAEMIQNLAQGKEDSDAAYNLIFEEKESLSSQVSQLNESRQEVLQENERFSTMIQDLSNEISNLSEEKEKVDIELANCNSKIAQLNEEYSQLSHSISQQSENSLLYTQLEEKHNTILGEKMGLEDKLYEVQADYNAFKVQFNQLSQDKNWLSKALSEAESKFFNEKILLEESLTDYQNKFNQLSAENEKLVNDFGVLNEQKVDAENKLIEYENIYAELLQQNGRLSSKTKENQELSSSLEEYKIKYNELQFEVTNVHEKLEEASQENSLLVQKLSSLENECYSFKCEYEKISHALNDTQEQLSRNLNEYQETFSKLEESNILISNMTLELNELKASKEVEIQRSSVTSQERQELENELGSLKQAYSLLQESEFQLGNANNEYINQLNELSARVEELKSEKHNLEQINSEQIAKISFLEDQVDVAKEVEDFESRIELLNREKIELDKLLETYTLKIQSLEQAVSSFELKNEESDALITSLNADKSSLEYRLGIYEDEKEELNSKLQYIMAEKESLETQCAQLSNEKQGLIDNKDENIDGFYNEINSLKSKIEADEAEIFSLQLRLHQMESSQENEKLEYTQTIDSLHEQKTLAENNLSRLNEEYMQSRSLLSSLETQLDELKSTCVESLHIKESVELDYRNLKSQLDESYFNNKELSAENDQMSNAVNILREQVADLQETLKAIRIDAERQSSDQQIGLSNAMLRYQEKIDQLESEMTLYKTRFEESESSFIQSSETIDILKREKEELSITVNNLNKRIDDLTNQHSLEVSELQDTLKSKTEAYDRLKTQSSLSENMLEGNIKTVELDLNHSRSIIFDLERQKDEYLIQIKELTEKLYQLTGTGNQTAKDIKEMSEQLGLLERDYHTTLEEKNRMAARCEEWEVEEIKLRSQLDDAIELGNQRQENCLSLENTIRKLKTDKVELEKQLSDHQKILKSTSPPNSPSRSDSSQLIKSLQERLGEKEKIISNLTSQTAYFSSKAASPDIALLEERDALKNESLTLALKLRSNENDLQKLKSELEEAFIRIKELECDFDDSRLLSKSEKMETNTIGTPKTPPNLSNGTESIANVGFIVETFILEVQKYQRKLDSWTNNSNLLDSFKDPQSFITPKSKDTLQLFISRLQEIKSSQENITTQSIALRTLLYKFQFANDHKTSNNNFSDTSSDNSYHLTNSEYMELYSKASQADQIHLQVANSQSLIKEYSREIKVLKETIDALTQANQNELFSSSGASHAGSSSFRLVQKQNEELRKIWSHELSANNVLRTLISKTQNDSVQLAKEASKREAELKNEIDELVVMLEKANEKSERLQLVSSEREANLKELTKKLDRKINSTLLEQQENAALLEEIHQTERENFNKQIKVLESERDRLISDFKLAKVKFDEKITLLNGQLKGSELKVADLSKRLSEEDAKYRKLLNDNNTFRTEQEKLVNLTEVLKKTHALAIKNLEAEIRGTVWREQQTVLDQRAQHDADLRNNYEKMILDIKSQNEKIDKKFKEADKVWQEERASLLKALKEAENDNLRLADSERSFSAGTVEQKMLLKELEAAWNIERKTLNDELSRAKAVMMKLDYADEEIAFFKNQKEKLEIIVQQRDARIKKLEDALEKVRSDFSFEGKRTVLEQQISYMNSENAALKNRIKQLESEKEKAQSIANDEKRRVDRYAVKVDELRKQLQVFTSSDQHNEKKSSEDLLKIEVAQLRKEVSRIKHSSTEIVTIIKGSLSAIFKNASIDTQDPKTLKVKLDFNKLRQLFGKMTQEVIFLRGVTSRLSLQRSDLQFQKKYLSLQVRDLLASQGATLSFIRGMGVSDGMPDVKISPRRKFIRCVTAVRIIFRLKALSKKWKNTADTSGRLFMIDGVLADSLYNTPEAKKILLLEEQLRREKDLRRQGLGGTFDSAGDHHGQCECCRKVQKFKSTLRANSTSPTRRIEVKV